MASANKPQSQRFVISFIICAADFCILTGFNSTEYHLQAR